MLPLTCMLVCRFVCANRTRDRGCSKHPVFPAPSDFRERQEKFNPRAQCAASRRMYVDPSLRAQRTGYLAGTGTCHPASICRPDRPSRGGLGRRRAIARHKAPIWKAN